MIPIEAAKKIADDHNLRQVIVFAWDGSLTHAVTYGRSIVDSAQAAAGANEIKREWGWPENTIGESAKVQALLDQIAKLEDQIEGIYQDLAGADL